jgi:urease accessory protein
MLVARAILGNRREPRFAGRAVEWIEVAWDEAGKRRLRRHTDAGTDVAIDVPRGSWLADGAVLHADEARVVAVRRRRERALVVRFDLSAPPERLVADALALGHAFGNQHVPIDVAGAEARVPLTTSEAGARATVEALGLTAATVDVAPVALGDERPLGAGSGHGHAAHDHTHGDHGP